MKLCSPFAIALLVGFVLCSAVEPENSERVQFAPAKGPALMQTGQALPGKAQPGPVFADLARVSGELEESLLLDETAGGDFEQLPAAEVKQKATAKLELPHGPDLAPAAVPSFTLMPEVLAFTMTVLFFKLLSVLLRYRAPRPSGEERASQPLAEDAFGCTLLHAAARDGAVVTVAKLLAAGADVHAREAWGETALHLAARSGCPETCDALVKAGASLQAVNDDDKTALIVAAEEGHSAACELLLDHGAGAGGASEDDLPPLLASLSLGRLLAKVHRD